MEHSVECWVECVQWQCAEQLRIPTDCNLTASALFNLKRLLSPTDKLSTIDNQQGSTKTRLFQRLKLLFTFHQSPFTSQKKG